MHCTRCGADSREGAQFCTKCGTRSRKTEARADADAHYHLGQEYKAQGKLDLAISEYREVLRIDPDNVLAHSNLAKIYVLQGKFDLAKQESEEVSRIDPSLTDVRNSPAMSQQSHPSTKKTMPMLPRVMLSVLAVFLVGGPVAALMGTHNAFVGIIAGAIAFLLLPSLFGSSD